MHMDYEELKDYLQNYDIKASNIRIKVLDFLLVGKKHPTAYEIYSQVVAEIPTLSKTSIYNTLDLFLDKGLVKTISLDDKEAHFDIVTDKHGHFKCQECGKIYDFKLNQNNYDDLKDFIIKNEDIHVYGICKECR